MAQTLYVPLSGVSDEVKKILVSTGGLSDYAVKGYCSVNGLSKLFFGFTPTPPVPTYNIVPEYTYVVNNTYQVHNLLTPQVALDALWQYFERIYTSSLTSVAYLKSHWSEIRSVILSYITPFNTAFISIGIQKRSNTASVMLSLGQNTYPKSSVINFQGSPRYGVLWRIYPPSSEAIQTTDNLNITITENSYTTTFQPWTAVMTDIGLYGAVSDNVNVSDLIEISTYGMKQE